MFEDKNPISLFFTSGPGAAFAKFMATKKRMAIRILAVLFLSYAAATIASSVLVNILMDTKTGKKKSKATAVLKKISYKKGKRFNYVKMRRVVINRNLFNSKGEYPDENQSADAEDNSPKKVFDPYAKCQKSRLNITLLGTIFVGSEDSSLATIKESGYDVADIYKSGDFIIGNDDAQIVAVLRNKVVINNNGIKECIEFDEKKLRKTSQSYEPTDNNNLPNLGGGINSGLTEAEGGCVVLEGSYVEEELGEGFSKVITAARLVPNMENNAVSGFKIFAINQSSLLGKAGFKNGDVITQVNDTSLKLPEQGFALYEAFQDEREIRIHVMRGGKTPKSLCVKIK